MTINELLQKGIKLNTDTLKRVFNRDDGTDYEMTITLQDDKELIEFYVEREGFLIEDNKRKVCKVIHTFEKIDMRFLLIDEEPHLITTPQVYLDTLFNDIYPYGVFTIADAAVTMEKLSMDTDPTKIFEFKIVYPKGC